MAPTKNDVRSILRLYHGRVRKVFELAWEEWRLVDSLRTENRLAPLLYSRTVTNYVFDAIARLAIAKFADDPTVQVIVEPQTVKFFFKGKVLARFKKGNENNLGQNNPTQASMAFADSDSILPGLPSEMAKVEFIWRANRLQTQLESVLVVCRDGGKMRWGYPIRAEESAAILPFPTAEVQMVEPDDEVDGLVKPKGSGAKTARKED